MSKEKTTLQTQTVNPFPGGMNFIVSNDPFDKLIEPLVVITTPNYPPLEFDLSLQVIPDLVDNTLSYLKNHGIVIMKEDTETLQKITMLQARLKIALARAEFPVSDDPDFMLLRENRNMLSVILKSHQLLIDQIGSFSIGNKTFIPKWSLPKKPEEITQDNPDKWALLRDIDLGKLDELKKLYNNFIERINKEPTFSMTSMTLTKTSGAASQLVGSTQLSKFGSELTKAWHHAIVSSRDLVLGAVFRFGLDSEYPLRFEETSACHIIFQEALFFDKIQRTMQQVSSPEPEPVTTKNNKTHENYYGNKRFTNCGVYRSQS